MVSACRFTGVAVKIEGVPQVAMVDTGATPSLLSRAMWVSLGRPELRVGKNGFVSANGSELKVLGSETFSVSLGSETFQQ